MSDFERKNLNPCDYESLTADWECQLRQLGYVRDYDFENGECGWRAASGGPVQTTYEAWSDATNTPADLKLGIEKEPPETKYRKPF